MAMVHYVEEHVCRIGAIGEVSHFVDDEDTRLDVRSERLGKLAPTKRRREVIDQLRGRDEARVEAILNRSVGNRDREMGLAAARFPTQDDAPPFGHKLGRERRPEQREADGRLVQEVEIVDGLQKRKASAAHEPRDARSVAEKILAVMHPAFDTGSLVLPVSTSIGLAFAAPGEDDADAFLKRADRALYEAKAAGRGTFREAGA